MLLHSGFRGSGIVTLVIFTLWSCSLTAVSLNLGFLKEQPLSEQCTEVSGGMGLSAIVCNLTVTKLMELAEDDFIELRLERINLWV